MREQPTFEQFLLQKADRNEKISKRGEEARCMTAVSMNRRYRGDSASDRYGYFSPNGTQAWLGDHRDDTEAMADMHCLPVVEQAVKANLSAMVTADVRVTVEPAGKLPSAAGVAGVAKGVAAYLDGHEDHWSDGLEARINLLSQLTSGYFIRARHNPYKQGERVAGREYGDREMSMPGEYACAGCGAGGPFEGEVTGEGEVTDDETTTCPECGAPAEVLTPPSTELMPAPTGLSYRNGGDAETTVHTSFECRVDERRSQGGNLRAATWFELHCLRSRDELAMENPGFNLNAPEQWSFSLKWLHALQSGSVEVFERWDDSGDLFEHREICLLPEDYATYRVPSGGGFVLTGFDGRPLLKDDGQPVFEIHDGERLIDRFPAGFRYRLCCKRVMPGTADDPGISAYDFRDEWTYGGFNPDPLSFWYRPLTAVLILHDDISTLYTIDIQAREKNSKTNLVYDDFAFDPGAFDYDEVPTKQGFILEQNDDLRRHYGILEAPQMREALEGLQFLFSIAPQVGSPPPAASGAPDPTEDTYRGQLLKRQAALGILTPSQQSKAKAKVALFKCHLKIAQQHWPDERFWYLRSRFGEEWKDEDIEAFRQADLDRVLEIGYAEGSDVPTTLQEREQKMGAFLMQLVQALPALAEAGELGAQLRELVSQYAELAGIDFDFGDAESDRRLAQARYDRIKAGLAQVQTEDDAFVLMSHPALQPFPREHHDVHIDFWADRARALLAAEEPDILLVGLCQEMIHRHEQVQAEQEKGAPQGQIAESMNYKDAPPSIQRQMEAAAGFQPAPDGESAGSSSGAAADPQIEAAKVAAEQQRTQIEAAHAAVEADRQRAHEAGESARDRSHAAAMKGMELASRERVAALQSQARREARPNA